VYGLKKIDYSWWLGPAQKLDTPDGLENLAPCVNVVEKWALYSAKESLDWSDSTKWGGLFDIYDLSRFTGIGFGLCNEVEVFIGWF